ncbi:hypothetical protein BDF20DRAFT_913344 [Mycotypha africana]|uniref:uncharacterized protein n=1 Tax=Mycotypha africana TaxID=64632 RepID=UPI00230034FB|nr:uncharacterized protein BDF20DRAFT_913344 [Mycotypha africana]KAI8979845.1 hypothetical protein BDF20DRAFT_913344 [Mycotypha africana]
MINDIRQKFLQLVKDITKLQWVRESLPAHSNYYEGLKRKLEKQIQLKNFSEKDFKIYQKEKDLKRSSIFHQQQQEQGTALNDKLESIKFYENAISQLQAQLNEAEVTLNEINDEKRRLDLLCEELHTLYDQVIMPDNEDSAYLFEQQLKKDVQQLNDDMPAIKAKLQNYSIAQSKLYKARDSIEKAMKSLPGASTFMDRQAIVATNSNNNNKKSNVKEYNHKLFSKTASLAISSSLLVDPIKNADMIAQEAYRLVKEATELLSTVESDPIPNIPVVKATNNVTDSNNHYYHHYYHHNTNTNNVIYILTHYRGYRLKIETILRTKINPRLHQLTNQLSATKYLHEQKLIEWIDSQIINLETYLKVNGLLSHQEHSLLDRDLSRLRVSSRAAIAAVASEEINHGRMTVDDVLDITRFIHIDGDETLPEYDEYQCSSRRNGIDNIGSSNGSNGTSSSSDNINDREERNRNSSNRPRMNSVDAAATANPIMATACAAVARVEPSSSSLYYSIMNSRGSADEQPHAYRNLLFQPNYPSDSLPPAYTR